MKNLKFDANGLVPAVVQDVENGEVLMVGYMNREAVEQTIATGLVTYWSRSRQKYWVKGETSGHIQTLVSLSVDCDQDCLLAKVQQTGPACHEGYRSCFFREINPETRELIIVADQLKTPDEIYGPVAT